MIANNRLHMANMLDDSMRRARAEASGEKGRDRDRTHIKTFLVEALLSEEAELGTAAAFIRSLFAGLSGRNMGVLTVTLATDDSVASVHTAVKGEPVVAYLDFTNPRFWKLHSLAKSELLDRLVSYWIDDLPELDRAWFPTRLLDSYGELGQLRGIGLEYNNAWLKGSDLDANEPDVFKMQLRSRQAGRVLKTMRSSNGEPHVARLSKVVVAAAGGSALSDIKYDGKVTGHGKSFDEHLAVTSAVFERYIDQIRLVESKYAIGPSGAGERLTVDGSPIVFDLVEPVPDLARFCDGMFSSTAPFRLWGNPIRVADDFYRVQALDLHSGRTLAFELTPRFIRVYLPRGSCGNSILRLYTNLQARYDARVDVVNGNGGRVFGF